MGRVIVVDLRKLLAGAEVACLLAAPIARGSTVRCMARMELTREMQKT